MSPLLMFFLVFLYYVDNFCGAVNTESKRLRELLSVIKRASRGNHTHNDTKDAKVTPSPLKDEESVAGTEVAVLFIVVIVVLSVIGMVIYFIRKFDQLNRSLPTYRYSSLKTEINGYGPDDKESQVLVSVSTEEEDDYDDEEDIDVSPPTLKVQSQTVMPNKSLNGSLPLIQESKNTVSSHSISKSGESSVDSDDELLQ